ncbi:MAG: DUF998 domain-containing protein [Candidatus Bathyarchaeota archaeon]
MRLHRVLGILGATVAYFFIAVSIVVSPWFNFYDNALSDLGNTALHSSTAWIFNTGLVLSGIFEASFAFLISRQRPSWKYLIWTVPLSVAGADLAMIGFFPENAGIVHLLVSVILFAFMSMAMFIYSYVSWPLGTPAIGAVALTFGLASVFVWFTQWSWKGVAIQETLTSAMASIWLILICLKGK